MVSITLINSAVAEIVTAHRRADTTASLTPKLLRSVLAAEHGLEWTDEEWKPVRRDQVKCEAERLLVRLQRTWKKAHDELTRLCCFCSRISRRRSSQALQLRPPPRENATQTPRASRNRASTTAPLGRTWRCGTPRARAGTELTALARCTDFQSHGRSGWD